MKNFHVAAIVTVALALTACTGQFVSTRELSRDASPDHGGYQVVPITPQLIATEQASTPPATIPAALLAYKPKPYRIGAGDTLNITVWEHPELTAPAGSQQSPSSNGRLVRADGTLFYPYVGVLKAAGMTLEQLRETLTRRLGAYLKDPQIDVSVINYGSQQLTIRGAFLKPTPQPITVTPLTLTQALGNAEIDTNYADLSGLVLVRDGKEYHLDMDALSRAQGGLDNIWLRAGDQIYLPYQDRKEIYVMGEVVRPMAIPFRTTDLNLTQVLGRAGGLNPITANGKAVYVIRGVKNMENTPAMIYHLDAKSPVAFALASEFSVHPGDVVFVGPAGVTRWSRFLSQLVPLTPLVNSIDTSAMTQNTLSTH